MEDQMDFQFRLTLWCYGDMAQREKFEVHLRQPANISKTGKAFRVLRYLPEEERLRIVRQRNELGIDKWGRLQLAHALSFHPNKVSASLLVELWDEDGDRRRNPDYAECFNRMADQNFGMRRSAIWTWIQTLR